MGFFRDQVNQPEGLQVADLVLIDRRGCIPNRFPSKAGDQLDGQAGQVRVRRDGKHISESGFGRNRRRVFIY